MKNIGSIYKRSLFIFSIFFLFFISLTATLSYFYSTISLGEQLEYTNIALLKQVNQNIDMRLKGVDSNILSFIQETDVRKFFDNSFGEEYSTQMGLYKLSERINTLKINNENIYSIYIYSLNTQKVLSGSWYGPVDKFVDKEWLTCFEHMKSEYFVWQGTKRVNSIEMEGQADKQVNGFNINRQADVNVISLIRLYPTLSNPITRKGAIVVNIDENVVYSILSKARPENLDRLFIVDISGNIISHDDKREIGSTITDQPYSSFVLSRDQGQISTSIDGVKSSVFFVTSEYTGWKYISIAQQSNAYYPLITLRNIIMIIALLTLGIALFSVFLVNRWMYKPVESFIDNMVQKSKKYKSEKETTFMPKNFQELESVFGEIFTEHESMQKQITASHQALRWQLVMDLLLGVKKSYTDIKDQLDLLNVRLSPENYLVMVAEVDDMEQLLQKISKEELALYISILCKKVNELVNEECSGAAIEINKNKVVVIVSFETDDADGNMITVFSLAELLKDFAKEYLNVTLTLGVGSTYKKVADISKSYSEAIEALNYKALMGKNSVICIEDIKPHNEKEFIKAFTMLGEVKSYVKDADITETKRLLQLIFDKVESNNFPVGIIRQLVMQLVLQGANALSEAGVNPEEVFEHNQGSLYDVIEQFETLDQMKLYVIKLFEMYCSKVQERKKKWGNSELMESVMQYINNNYMNNDMCLNHLSQVFHFSVPYLSKIFKESNGMNFIDYLIKIRMEKAKELLAKGDVKVNEISEKIGYTNPHGFIKIFKKYTGMTPGEFRGKNIVDNLIEE